MVIKIQERVVMSTGNNEIDKKLGGGIPKGSLTLIEGDSDSGKSVLCQQLVWGSVNSRFKVTVFTTENTVKSLIHQMSSLNLDVYDQFMLGLLRIYPVKAMKSVDVVERALYAMLKALASQGSRDLVVVDSLTSFLAHATVTQCISFFEECKTLCNKGMTLITVVHSYAFADSTLIRIRSMCDAHFSLKSEAVGTKLVKMLEVGKVRGAEQSTGNIVTFDVEPAWGMRIIPFTKARA